MHGNPKICLFTAHSPSGGGGGAILRSLIPHLEKDLDIQWCYLSREADADRPNGWLGRPLIGGSRPLPDIVRTTCILTGVRFGGWNQLLANLQGIDCDAYWVVSHNEGLRLAHDLGRLTGRPVHLTVHDDWAGALCARSQRYYFLSPLADRLSEMAVKSAKSVDVVSEGMRRYYVDKFGVDSTVLHRCLARTEIAKCVTPNAGIRVGHLGSLYAKSDFFAFLQALKVVSFERRLPATVTLWGPNIAIDQVPQDLSSYVEFFPTTDEQAIIEKLENCDFAYAAYPFTQRLQCFGQTSLPTKLSTYVAAQCPILGHAPSDSTLATFLRQTKVGVAWHDLDRDHGVNAINSVLALKPPEHAWDDAMSTFFGRANVENMRKLLFQAARHSPK
jgi:hypothetical protein